MPDACKVWISDVLARTPIYKKLPRAAGATSLRAEGARRYKVSLVTSDLEIRIPRLWAARETTGEGRREKGERFQALMIRWIIAYNFRIFSRVQTPTRVGGREGEERRGTKPTANNNTTHNRPPPKRPRPDSSVARNPECVLAQPVTSPRLRCQCRMFGPEEG